ncbi:uncharacterized protein LOC133909839 [Phragmites australis]|uniref:uncharacterized protein LOC133909839 n=1 Tax=Phragmites australis TaxID=29695 RepID=UPI002D77F58F|nr:uncharacterized protein LOC133909839 [Phragmites australis]
MEQEEAGEAGVRKRKRDTDVGVEMGGGGGGAYEKDLLEEGCYEGIAEEAVEDVMRWLEAEISDAPAAAEADAGFVTINGNEESCGPSFSAAASTVMASVDTRAGAPPPSPVPWPWPQPQPQPLPEAAKQEEDVEMGEADEEWLAQLLTFGPALEVEGV